jgi:hypothetical protein
MHLPAKSSIKRLTASRDLDDAFAQVTELMSSLEAASSRLHATSVRFTVIRRRRRSPLRNEVRNIPDTSR